MSTTQAAPGIPPTKRPLTPPDEPSSGPRPYYGWVMLGLAIGALVLTSPGQTFGVSVFIPAIRRSLGLTYTEIATAYMSGTLLGAVPITWIGYQVDRRGIRATLLAVLACFALACLLLATAYHWLQLLAAFTFLRMLGPGALSLISSNVLPFWFKRRLGAVEGVRRTSMAAAMGVVPAIYLGLLRQIGWRNAYIWMAVLLLCVALPAYWRWFRGRPEEVAQHVEEDAEPDDSPSSHPPRAPGSAYTFRGILTTHAFWGVVLGSSLFGMIHTGVFFNLTPLVEERGLTDGHAATMLTCFAVSLGSLQLVGGWLSDRVSAAVQLTLGMALFSGGLFGLWRADSAGSLFAAGAVLGAAQGMYVATAQPLWAKYFGTEHLGKLRGLLIAFNIGATSLGPFLVGLARDQSGVYDGILFWFACTPLPLTAVAAFTRPPATNESR